MKLLLIFLLAIIGTVAGIIATIPKSNASVAGDTVEATKPVARTPQQSAIVIDGAKNPEKIPDHIAYSLMFDLIAGRETETEKHRVRYYIKQIGLNDGDVDTVINAAEEYYQRVSVLGNQAKKIKDRNHPVHDSLTVEEEKQLKQLDKQRKSIVRDVIASLLRSLSNEGVVEMREHIDGRVKRKTKMSADQSIE